MLCPHCGGRIRPPKRRTSPTSIAAFKKNLERSFGPWKVHPGTLLQIFENGRQGSPAWNPELFRKEINKTTDAGYSKKQAERIFKKALSGELGSIAAMMDASDSNQGSKLRL